MKKLRSSVFLFSLLFCAMFFVSIPKAHADTTVDSDITSDTTWDAVDSPYIISDPINVVKGATLTVSPGVVVLFDYGAEIKVAGKIIADGTSDSKIYFTSLNDSTLNGQTIDDVDSDLVIPPTVGDYNGLLFSASSTGEFQYVEMRYSLDGIDSNKASISISNSTFINNYSGVLTKTGSLNLSNTVFSNNDTPLEVSLTTQFSHSGNTFSGNTNNDIEIYDNFPSGQDYDFSFDSVPYFILSNNINLSSGRTLTIDPGVTLLNGGTTDLTISINNGILNAVGTADKRITFDGISFYSAGSNPQLVIKNADIKNVTGGEGNSAILASSGSVVADGVNMTNVASGFFLVNDAVDADIENTNITVANDTGSGNGIFASDNAYVFLQNVSIQKTPSSGDYFGILSRANSTVIAGNVTVDGFEDGMLVYDNTNINGVKIDIKNSTDAGIMSFNEMNGSTSTSPYTNNSIKLRQTEISNNNYGIINYGDTDLDISGDSIVSNIVAGMAINDDDIYQGDINGPADEQFLWTRNSGEMINIADNWWGDLSGPNDIINNPNGKGNGILETLKDYSGLCGGEACFILKNANPTQIINFTPWIVRDPSLLQKTPVLIVPGVLGTEISKPEADGSLEKLWLDLEHNITDIGDGFMDPLQFNDDLTPSDTSLVLGDILRKTTATVGNVTFPIFNYSDGLITEFQNQGYTEGSDLFVFPYDWRYGVSENTVSQLKQKIADITAETGSDKVDIVAHSTGGLLVKKYVMENPTTNDIDKAVFVGVPETGAPKAIKTLLEGDDFDNPFLSDGEMQKIARNLPVVYDLAPSAEYYKNKGSFVRTVDDHFITSTVKDLSFDDMTDFLIGTHNFNAQAWTNAQNLHTSDFDNYDMRTAGVDVYAIDGCKTGTIGKITEVNSIFPTYDALIETPGDGTVPLESATNLPINDANKYYALKANHGDMLSQDGIRQQIVNIISGMSTAISSDLITQDVDQCGLNGRAISIYSPLSIDIVDQDGNHSGLSSDGVSIENNIPNADYEIMGDHKFVYLPTDNGQIYTIKVAGTGNGVFTLTDATIANSNTTGMQVFSQIPVTTSLKGNVNIGNTTTLTLDTDGDGAIDQTLKPTAALDAVDAQNFDPEQFETNNFNSVAVADTQSGDRNSGGHFVSSSQKITTTITSNTLSETATSSLIIPQDNTSTVKSIPETPVISYNKSVTKDDSSVGSPTESNKGAVSTSSVLVAMSEGSKIPISPVVAFVSLFSLTVLAFVGKKFIKY